MPGRHREIALAQISGRGAQILLETVWNRDLSSYNPDGPLAIHVFGHVEFVGTPAAVADRLDSFVQNDGSDGFIIGSHLTPTGLDEFVDKVVPLLQERGSLRTEYDGTTLRENLRLPVPAE